MSFKLLPIKPFLPPYSSPPRIPAPLIPELQDSPGYSPARPVPNALLRPSPKKNGLNMRGKGGSYKYQAPEEIARSRMRNTLNEENRERAQKARSKLIFDPEFIGRWERGDPFAHQRLANLGRVAAGNKPLEPLPLPPPPPVKLPRVKPLIFNNNNNNNNAVPITAPPSAVVQPPNAREPPLAPSLLVKRPRPSRKVKKDRRRKTQRLKNRRNN